MAKIVKVSGQDVGVALNAFVDAKFKEYGSHSYAVGFFISLVIEMAGKLDNKSRQDIVDRLKRLTK